ncbi:MAG: hypothetical protein PUB10_07035 [Clostridiales bacterium]|nr:hypothetical protein [Clostridiales bacterium]
MKQYGKIQRIISRVLLAALIVMTAAGVVTPVEAADNKNKDVVLTTEQGLTVTIEYGFSHYAKYGRNLPVRAVVENQGNDFEGELQILVSRQNDSNTMFGRQVSVAAGETKTVEIPVFLDFINNTIYARIMEDDKEIAGTKLTLSVKGSSAVAFTGLLSDQPEELSYLNDKKSLQTFELTAKTFPEEEKMLDCLDVIVMDNFDSSTLSEKQYETLKKWIEQGGSLVMGTGLNGGKVFRRFQDDFLTGKVQEGEDNQAVIEMDGALLAEDQVIPYYSVAKGKGNVIIFERAMTEYNSKENAAIMISEIYDSLSSSKRNQLENEEMQNVDYYYYSARSCISALSRKLLPKVSDYAAVLLIYCVVAGPILYLVFKKWDKRNFLWLAIPATALVFSGVIYLIGGKTRVTQPFANYLTVSRLSGTGQLTSNDTTFFGILAAKNKKYEFHVAADRNLTLLSDTDEYYGDQTTKKPDFSNYKTGMVMGADVSKLILNHKDIFSWTCFKDESVSEEKGSVSYDLTCDQLKTTGSITNQLGYNLENVTVYAGNELYFVGDLADGGTAQLPTKKTQHIYNSDSLYVSGDVYETMAGGSYYSMSPSDERYEDLYKKYNALSYYFSTNNASWMTEGDFLIGFTKEERKDSSNGTIISELGIENYGIRMVVLPLDITHTYQKMTLEDSIDSYLVGRLEDLGVSSATYRSMSQNVTAVYRFDKANLPDKLAYLEAFNPELGKQSAQYYTRFEGKIYTLDESGKKIELFKSGEEKILDIKKYIDKDGKLTLFYERDESKAHNMDIGLPVLSLLREAE